MISQKNEENKETLMAPAFLEMDVHKSMNKYLMF